MSDQIHIDPRHQSSLQPKGAKKKRTLELSPSVGSTEMGSFNPKLALSTSARQDGLGSCGPSGRVWANRRIDHGQRGVPLDLQNCSCLLMFTGKLIQFGSPIWRSLSHSHGWGQQSTSRWLVSVGIVRFPGSPRRSLPWTPTREWSFYPQIRGEVAWT